MEAPNKKLVSAENRGGIRGHVGSFLRVPQIGEERDMPDSAHPTCPTGRMLNARGQGDRQDLMKYTGPEQRRTSGEKAAELAKLLHEEAKVI